MRRVLSRPFLVVLGIAVSFVFTYVAVRDVDPDAFWQVLRSSEYWWLIPSLLLLAVGVFLRALRWQCLFSSETRPPLTAVLRALLAGYFFNNVLPARAGEAARIVVLHREAKTSRAESLGTAVVERAYDLVALLLLLFLSVPFLPEVTWLRRTAWLAVVVLVAVAATVVVLGRYGARPLRYVLRPLARFPRISDELVDEAAVKLTQGLGALHRPRLAVPAFVLTVASWLVIAASFWVAMMGFDLNTGFSAGLLVLITVNFAMVIPSAPGAVGTFEAASLAALQPYGVGDSEALAYAVVLHALNLFPFIIAGAVVLRRYARAGRSIDEVADPGNRERAWAADVQRS